MQSWKIIKQPEQYEINKIPRQLYLDSLKGGGSSPVRPPDVYKRQGQCSQLSTIILLKRIVVRMFIGYSKGDNKRTEIFPVSSCMKFHLHIQLNYFFSKDNTWLI